MSSFAPAEPTLVSVNSSLRQLLDRLFFHSTEIFKFLSVRLLPSMRLGDLDGFTMMATVQSPQTMTKSKGLVASFKHLFCPSYISVKHALSYCFKEKAETSTALLSLCVSSLPKLAQECQSLVAHHIQDRSRRLLKC